VAARLMMADAAGAGAFLRVIPTERGLELSNNVMKPAVRARLGCSEIEHPLRCVCKDRFRLVPNDEASMVHLATCKVLGGQIFTHDCVVALTRQIIKSIPGLVHRCEDTSLLHNARVDLAVWSDEHPQGHIYDPTVANPLAAKMVGAASQKTLAAAKKREQAKRSKWEARARAEGFGFTPLAFEPSGGMAKNTQLFYRSLVARKNELEPYVPVNWAATSRFDYWAQRFSVVLARGTTRATRRLYSLCKSRQ
jgi:hypothetical protein